MHTSFFNKEAFRPLRYRKPFVSEVVLFVASIGVSSNKKIKKYIYTFNSEYVLQKSDNCSKML